MYHREQEIVQIFKTHQPNMTYLQVVLKF